MGNLKVLGLLAEKDGKVIYIPVDDSTCVDLSQGVAVKEEPEGTGITEAISPEEEKQINQQEFEEGLDKRLKRK